MDEGKAPCSNCLAETCHKTLHTEEREFEFDEEMFQLIECAGCGQISMSHSWRVLREDWENEEDWEILAYYPSPASRPQPSWLRITHSRSVVGMDHDLSGLFAEIYEALAGGQHRLAAMGIRALLEQVMVIKVGDHGSFGENLDAFCEKGFISRIQRDALGAVLDLGHAATHRMYKPTESDLNTALDITEGVLAAICRRIGR